MLKKIINSLQLHLQRQFKIIKYFKREEVNLYDPAKCDKITQINTQIDETKEVLVFLFFQLLYRIVQLIVFLNEVPN